MSGEGVEDFIRRLPNDVSSLMEVVLARIEYVCPHNIASPR